MDANLTMRIDDEVIARAFQNCHSFSMQRHSRTFSFATALMPARTADALRKVYCFCRLVDDVADEMTDKNLAESILSQISLDLERKQSKVAEISAFLALAHENSIDLRIANELVNGVKSELGGIKISDEATLLQYCYKVAGTVAVMICQLLEIYSLEARCFAIDLAIAMQLTNIARDVHADVLQNRIYIPEAWISSQAVKESLASASNENNVLLARSVSALLALSEKYYRSSDQGICLLPPSARISILTSSRCYESIGVLIKRDIDSKSWDPKKRCIVPGRLKLQKLFGAAFALASNQTNILPSEVKHDASLHSYLHGLPYFDLAFGS